MGQFARSDASFILGDGENLNVCLPSPGPGVSAMILPFEIAVSPLASESPDRITASSGPISARSTAARRLVVQSDQFSPHRVRATLSSRPYFLNQRCAKLLIDLGGR